MALTQLNITFVTQNSNTSAAPTIVEPPSQLLLSSFLPSRAVSLSHHLFLYFPFAFFPSLMVLQIRDLECYEPLCAFDSLRFRLPGHCPSPSQASPASGQRQPCQKNAPCSLELQEAQPFRRRRRC